MPHRLSVATMVLALQDNHEPAITIPAGKIVDVVGPAEDDRVVVKRSQKGTKSMAQGATKRALAAAATEASFREQTATLAYQLWQQRGCPDGSPDEDWLRAEQELTGVLRMWSRQAQSHDDWFLAEQELRALASQG